MNMDEKKELCRAAMTLKASAFNDWELGFIQGVALGSGGAKNEFFQRLTRLLAPQPKE